MRYVENVNVECFYLFCVEVVAVFQSSLDPNNQSEIIPLAGRDEEKRYLWRNIILDWP